jgi:hypothetical protein
VPSFSTRRCNRDRRQAGDYFHCPAGVAHIVVGAGEGPAFLIAVGGRVGPGNPVYPVDRVALKHGAGVEQETRVPADAYASFAEAEPIPFREELLPTTEDAAN